MRFPRQTSLLRYGLLLLLGSTIADGPRPANADGVTIITHGFSSNAQGWVLGMAGAVPGYEPAPGTGIICYEVRIDYDGGFTSTAHKLSGGDPTIDPHAEIVIKLDWSALAGVFAAYDTYQVASAVVPSLLEPGFIPELNGHALAELPLHLIGHSRGGSLVCQMSRLLGTNGVWVDQVTTLDPHPVNEDGNSYPFFSYSDAPLRIYDNVLFADNYYQDFGGIPHGQSMPNSCNRRLTALPGGYSSAHSDAHLWYHATIDLRMTADDSEAVLAAGDRTVWYALAEEGGARAGFHYSRLGTGDRLSEDVVSGAGSDRPVDGINQRWDFGAGVDPNRTALPDYSRAWPNPIHLTLAGTNQVARDRSSFVNLHYQWAEPAISNATLSVYLDGDRNPWNGNERLVRQLTVAGTTATNIGAVAIEFEPGSAGVEPGVYSIYVEMSSGGRTRYLYAAGSLTVTPEQAPLLLSIVPGAGSEFRIDISGEPGQRVILQSSVDLLMWEPLATNSLPAADWSYTGEVSTGGRRFYRAVLE